MGRAESRARERRLSRDVRDLEERFPFTGNYIRGLFKIVDDKRAVESAIESALSVGVDPKELLEATKRNLPRSLEAMGAAFRDAAKKITEFEIAAGRLEPEPELQGSSLADLREYFKE